MKQPQDRLDTVKKAWDTYHADRSKGLEVSWWDSPVIVEECQRLVTGNPKMDIYEFLKKRLPAHPFENGLSICSGSGDFERGLLDSHICKSIDAYEIAEERVREGVRLAKEKNYAITFHVEDVNEASFGTNCYDIFFSWSALHHIKQLERVCDTVRTSLRDDGVLVAQEYIGPNQFQWTDKQIQLINKILNLLPNQFKRSSRTGAVIDSVRRPTIQSMNESDPSEAIRSEDIIPTLQHYFKINAIRFFGGSIYHPLFSEIVRNFDHNDQKDISLIKLVLLLERVLVEEGILDNHYAVIIGEKR